APLDLHSFPTRRSSDLQAGTGTAVLLDHYPTSKVIKEDHNVKFGIHPSYKLYRGDIAATVTLKKPSTKFKHLADVCTEATEACRSEEHTSELQSRFDLV